MVILEAVLFVELYCVILRGVSTTLTDRNNGQNIRNVFRVSKVILKYQSIIFCLYRTAKSKRGLAVMRKKFVKVTKCVYSSTVLMLLVFTSFTLMHQYCNNDPIIKYYTTDRGHSAS